MKTLGPTEVKSFTRWKLKELGLKPLIWTTALSSKRTCSVIKICSRMFRRWWWFSCSVVSNSCNPMDCSPPGSSIHGIIQARILVWVAISFSRGIFLTQESNSGLPQCRQILYWLSFEGSFSFSRGSSQPRDQACISCILRQICYHWVTRVGITLVHPPDLSRENCGKKL